MSIHQKIRAWFGSYSDRTHQRYRSWEHCYGFFQRVTQKGIAVDRERAALHLGFFLASWGMYRGSTFLLQHAYTVHLAAIDVLAAPDSSLLWKLEVGADDEQPEAVESVLALVESLRNAYAPFGYATDTLVTKIILATVGSLPACDRYFIEGFRHEGCTWSWVNESFVAQVCGFCRDHRAELRREQARIRDRTGASYPLMKLVDMYFHQIGIEMSEGTAAAGQDV